MGTVFHSTDYIVNKALFNKEHRVLSKEKNLRSVLKLREIEPKIAQATNFIDNPAAREGTPTNDDLYRPLTVVDRAITELGKAQTKVAFETAAALAGTAANFRNQINDLESGIEQKKKDLPRNNIKLIIKAIKERKPEAMIAGMIDKLDKEVQKLLKDLGDLETRKKTLAEKLNEFADQTSRQAAHITQAPVTTSELR